MRIGSFMAAPLLVLAFGGCTDESPEQQGPLARVDITDTETSLAISGIGHDGHEVGRLDLSIGRFTLEEDGRSVVGRMMTITSDKGLTWKSQQNGLLDATIAGPVEHRDLLTDPRVESVLAKWHITFNWKAPGNADWPSKLVEEQPYHVLDPYWGSGACTLHQMPSVSGGRFWPGGSEGGDHTACFELDYGDWHQERVVCSSAVAGYRMQNCNFACINYVQEGSAVPCGSDGDCPGSCNHCDTDNGFCSSWEGDGWTGPRGCTAPNDNVGWYYCSVDSSWPHAHW